MASASRGSRWMGIWKLPVERRGSRAGLECCSAGKAALALAPGELCGPELARSCA